MNRVEFIKVMVSHHALVFRAATTQRLAIEQVGSVERGSEVLVVELIDNWMVAISSLRWSWTNRPQNGRRAQNGHREGRLSRTERAAFRHPKISL